MTTPPPKRPPVASGRLYYGWIVAATASLAIFASGPGQTFNVSVFIDPIIADTGWSRTFVSGLYTLGSLSAAALMPFAGRLVDRWGGRVALTVVALLFGAVLISLSQVTHPAELWLGFMAIRLLGQGSLVLIGTVLVAMWFHRLRGRATSLTLLGMAAGTMVFPPLSYTLIEAYGWRGAWAGLGLLIWVILLVPAIVLARRSPESVGLRPDGDSDAAFTAAQERAAGTTHDWTLSAAMRTRAFWLLLLATATPSFTLTALPFHHVSLVGAKGIEAGVAVGVLSILGPASVVGTLSVGYLADRIPSRVVLLVSQSMLVGALALSLIMQSPWQAGLYIAALGVGNGAVATLNPVVWANYFGRRHLGSIRSVTQTAVMTGAAVAPLPVGFLFDFTGSYFLATLIMLGTVAAAMTGSVLARPPKPPTAGTQ